METRTVRGDYNAPDGLLIIVDSTGIPVLVRPYGDVQIPPSAMIGIISAVYHAAKLDDVSELRRLHATNYTIVYLQGEGDILMIFVKTQGDDDAGVTSRSADCMLRLLFQTLMVTLGPSISDLDSSKLRVTISRNLTIIDYVVTQSTDDVHLSLGLLVCGLEYGREREIPASQSSALLQALWFQDGIVCHEMGSSTSVGFKEEDLMIVSINAALHVKSKHPNVAIGVGKSLKIVCLQKESWRNDQFVMGVFTHHATSHDIENLTALAESRPMGFSNQAESYPLYMRQWFNQGLQLCFVAPLERSAMHRAFVLRNPEQEGPLAWKQLSHFAQSCSTQPGNPRIRRIDYKQEDETSTLIHCVRDPVSIYAIFSGSVSMPTAAALGDTIAEQFLLSAM